MYIVQCAVWGVQFVLYGGAPMLESVSCVISSMRREGYNVTFSGKNVEYCVKCGVLKANYNT